MTDISALKDLTKRANGAFSQSQLPQALALINEAQAIRADHPPILRLKMRTYMGLGQMTEALAVMDALPDDLLRGKLIDISARLLLATGNIDRAAALIDSVPQAGTTDPAYQVAAIRVTEMAQGGPEALALATRFADAHPDHKLVFKEFLRLSQQHGEKAQVLDLLRAAIADSPEDVYIRDLAQLLVQMDQPQDALELLDTHAALKSKHGWWYGTRLDALALMPPGPTLIATAEEAAAQYPDDPKIHERLWQALASDRQRDDAVARCRAFADARPGHAPAQLAAAQFLMSAGEADAADGVVRRMSETMGDTAMSLIIQAKLSFIQHDALGALALGRRALELPEAPADTLRVIARAERALGDHTSALDRILSYIPGAPNDVGARLDAAESYSIIGEFDKAQAFLDEVSDSRSAVQPRRHFIRAKMALSQSDFTAFSKACETAIAHDPKASAPYMYLALAQMLMGDIDTAWQTQHVHARVRATEDLSGQASMKPRKSVLGHLLNEFRLLGRDPDLALCGPDHDPAETLPIFRAKVEEMPETTAYALCQLTALRKLGGVSDTPPAADVSAAERIPRKLYQFWDKAERPEQVQWVMDQNRTLNPDFDVTVFTEESGVRYLYDKGETKALRGYQLAMTAAQKADILRLALLWHEGGVYMDADDRCLHPLGDWLDLRMNFVGYQEFYRSIGNNFLAAAPGQPMFRAALDQAAEASLGPLGETLWLSTGPGAVTRAFAHLATGADGYPLDGQWILPDTALRRHIGMHSRLSYKSSDSHWIRQFMNAGTPARSPKARA
ncbi:MAG: glycosyltransferase [Marinibacterium sp.]|nr:glycosyltransferase [Marinibacterium sp.]